MDPFIAEIRAVSFSFAPRGWALCNGQLLAIGQNQALFALLGTQFGGNGTTTFGLPDLRGQTPISAGNNAPVGQRAGSETVTMNSNQLPSHNHNVQVSNTPGSAGDPTGQVWGTVLDSSGVINMAFTENAPNTLMNPSALSTTGGSQPISVLQPFTVVNYIIALSGIFPSRG